VRASGWSGGQDGVVGGRPDGTQERLVVASGSRKQDIAVVGVQVDPVFVGHVQEVLDQEAVLGGVQGVQGVAGVEAAGDVGHAGVERAPREEFAQVGLVADDKGVPGGGAGAGLDDDRPAQRRRGGGDLAFFIRCLSV